MSGNSVDKTSLRLRDVLVSVSGVLKLRYIHLHIPCYSQYLITSVNYVELCKRGQLK